MSAILPGATIGILGGGQLGRMTAMAARSLGFHVHALDPDASCAARFVVERCLMAQFDDDFAAADLARHCQVVTLEIEKISIAALEAAGRYAPVRPGPRVLEIVQDRSKQKAWLRERGFPLGPYEDASSGEGVRQASQRLGGAAFVKAARGGYDGRSQVRITSPVEGAAAFESLGKGPVVVEKALEIESEVSVLVARTPSGGIAVYEPALNHHENRILAWSVLPAPIDPAVAKKVREVASAVAAALAIEGLLVVEFFLVKGGALYVNELAPRPHNSFHATEVACATSQFEQAVRAVCDLPLGSTEVLRPAAIRNLLGDLWGEDRTPHFDAALALPGVRLHLYGKRVARPGRKMGHLSAQGKTPQDAVLLVEEAYRRLAPV
ncbi:MAG TPA: 5-(carboxyamino)imidazole ribonucleotide synthase [Planctomycetota bacterium]|nr:5-(carboxyamino)imidazole ribonucleotide synthase [Planctomycetota bacterium]